MEHVQRLCLKKHAVTTRAKKSCQVNIRRTSKKIGKGFTLILSMLTNSTGYICVLAASVPIVISIVISSQSEDSSDSDLQLLFASLKKRRKREIPSDS